MSGPAKCLLQARQRAISLWLPIAFLPNIWTLAVSSYVYSHRMPQRGYRRKQTGCALPLGPVCTRTFGRLACVAKTQQSTSGRRLVLDDPVRTGAAPRAAELALVRVVHH